MIRLERLTIRKFRHAEPCSLECDPGLNVLLGRNGTGKTTLLELISAIARGVCDFRDEEASFDYTGTLASFEDERMSLDASITIAKAEPTFSLPSPHTDQRPPPSFYVRESLTFLSASSETRYEYDSREGKVRILGGKDLSVPAGSTHLDRIWLTALSLAHEHRGSWEGVFSWYYNGRPVVRFDEAGDYFQRLVAPSQAPTRTSPWLIIEALGPGHRGNSWNLLPFSVVLSVRNLSTVDQPVLVVEGLPFLSNAARLLGFAKISIWLHQISKEKRGDADVLTYGSLVFKISRADGSTIPHDWLSYGQKRLLAFLYYLELNPEFAIADEIVNGFHDVWIREALSAIGSRQAFLTSQNPLLLDHMHFESEETVRSRLLLCDSVSDSCVRWRNMPDAYAQSFYSALQVGIQSVSEILRTKGYW